MATLALGARQSRAAVRTGRTLSGIAVAFMIFDSVIHLAKPAVVTQAFAQLGFPESQSITIGVLAFVGVAIYLIPRSAVLGAVILTGYLGGAIAIQLRVGAVPFNVIFPVMVAALFWGGLALRDARVAAWLIDRD